MAVGVGCARDRVGSPLGCMAQAWSVAELLRAAVEDVYAAGNVAKVGSQFRLG